MGVEPAASSFEADNFKFQRSGFALKSRLGEMLKGLAMLRYDQRINLFADDLPRRIRLDHAQTGGIQLENRAVTRKDFHAFGFGFDDRSQPPFVFRQSLVGDL